MGSPSSNGGATADGRTTDNGRATAISPELLASFDEAKAAELARRLEEDDYPTPFAGLDDWHLLRALAIHRPDLAAPYVHLVDQEPFDED
ncbi:DUF2555 domain-containing protein [Synechococcus sp. CBW1004]|jgi:hypothetical protein|uniref:protein IsiD n=1 Tax=Synechococcus sp. CBW1004 TaxID=1353136 RepID=UPI0018CC8C97|nr:DUF2555 domain-containing protein [Synechococcus sp. CBW1004]QPN62246.1 DUF2555 domain-containing protein [Synechococcus sp. CBW1004]